MAEFNREWLGRVPEAPGQPLDDGVYQARVSEAVRAGPGRAGQRVVLDEPARCVDLDLDEQLGGIRFMTRIAAGFIEELDGAFGIIVYTESPQSGGTDEEYGEPAQRLRAPISMRADDREFPVIIRDSVVERHWCTAPEVTAPSIARATCWVRSAARGYEGWLMPRHAVDPLSAVVSFSDGGSGKLLDHFGERIDSVVISSNAGPPGGMHTKACWPLLPAQACLSRTAPAATRP